METTQVSTKPEPNAQEWAPKMTTRQALSLNPLNDSNWDTLVAAHGKSCFFHSSAWCRILHDTYGHQPFYFGTVTDSRLEGLLPLMEVSSPLTGKRGVSLPFTDACPQLATDALDAGQLFEAAKQKGIQRSWKYLEFRNSRPPWPGCFPSLKFWSHIVDLSGGSEAVFRNLEAAVRRGVRKAEASGLEVEIDDSAEAIRQFYTLHCETRRRHGVPPQPLRFFANIARHALGLKQGFVVTAWLGKKAVASAVFFHWGREAIYKFGASNLRFQDLRPNNLVMWTAIKKYAEEGFNRLDLGRTSLANEGLRRFKAGFGASEEKVEYSKYDLREQRFVEDTDRAEGGINKIFRCLPLPLFRMAGKALYPHLS